MKVSTVSNDFVEKVSKSSIITNIVRQILSTMNSDAALIETTIKVPKGGLCALREFGMPEDVLAFLEHEVIECKLPINVATRIPVLMWNIKNF